MKHIRKFNENAMVDSQIQEIKEFNTLEYTKLDRGWKKR